MLLVDSKQKMLETGQVIAIDATHTRQQQPAQMAKAAFAKLMTYPGSNALRYGNTIFVALISQQNTSSAVVFTANADIAPNVPINMMHLFDNLQKKGVSKISMVANESETIAAIQQLSQKYDIKMQRIKPDTYDVLITLGAPQASGLTLGA
jgi:hypothetical protein